METIRGRCHCGNLSFELDWPAEGETIAVRACSCDFCTRHGGVYTSNRQARLRGHVEDPAQLSRYTFGTRTAEFYICTQCGCAPFVTSRIDGHLYGVVNVNAFVDVDRSRLDASTIDLEGEQLEHRLARRARTWIPDVEVIVKET